MVKKFKHRFYIRWLLTWICKAKNADSDKYRYSGYDIRFNSRSEFSLPNGSMGRNVIILELIWAHLYILIIKIKTS